MYVTGSWSLTSRGGHVPGGYIFPLRGCECTVFKLFANLPNGGHLIRSDMMFMQEQDSLPDLAAAWRAVGAVDQYAGTITTTTTTTQAAATASSSASVSSHVDQYSNSFSALDR
jgi:hypothetical protein